MLNKQLGSIVGHTISGRINKNQTASVVTKTQDSTGTNGNNLSLNMPSSTINIADLLDVVNGTYRSVLSQDVLDHYNEIRPEKGYYTN